MGPRYWLTWVGIFFLYLISWLPHKLQLALGKLLGRLVHRFMKRRRHIAEVNIRLCFPEMPEHEQRELVRVVHALAFQESTNEYSPQQYGDDVS